MIFNCLNCGVSISSNQKTCPYCRQNNAQIIDMMKDDKIQTEENNWKLKTRGTILSFVHR